VVSVPDPFAALMREYQDKTWRLNPVSATSLGIHDFDADLPDLTPDGIQHSRHVLSALLQRLEAVEAASLSDLQRLERTVVEANLKRALRDCEVLREWQRAPHLYTDIATRAIFPLLARDFAPLPERMEHARDRLRGIPNLLETAQRNLTADASPISCDIGRRAAAGGVRFFTTAVAREAERVGGALGAELDSAATQAATALEQFGTFLEGFNTTAHGDFAAGREHFDFLLREYHLVDYDAESLAAYGEDLANRLEADLREAARSIDPTRSWPELIEEIKLDHPAAPDLVDAYRQEMLIARQAVLDFEVASIPEGESCDVDWLPEFLRPIAPIAIFNSTPLFETQDRSIWLVTPIDSSWPAERQESQLRDHNWVFLRTIAMHETYPGHHLQPVHAKRQPSAILRGNRSTLMSEGWGLYTEDVFWEVGFLADPRQRLWQLKHALWRAVRLIVDTGIHARGMQFQTAVDLLVDRVKLERPSAIGEITRYTTAPTQPSSYQLGRDLIMQTRETCRTRQGSAFSLRGFHDRFLRYGSIPVRLIRDDLLGPNPTDGGPAV
jgi:uncharacterized protein (DUF885 family)